jgi:hypothetical protein
VAATVASIVAESIVGIDARSSVKRGWHSRSEIAGPKSCVTTRKGLEDLRAPLAISFGVNVVILL